MVTLQDVADKAGISLSAASKALKGYDDISDSLKEKVKKIAIEMDYKPNMIARAFRTKKTYNIGTIYGFEGNGTLTHTFFATVLNSFCNQLEKEGYDLTYISSKVGQNRESFLDHCKQKGFEGLLLACVDYNDPKIIELTNSEIPFVSIDNFFNKGVGVTSDNYSGIKLLLEYSINNGHKNICFIHGQDGYATRIRKQAFIEIMNKNKLDINENNIIESEYYNTEKSIEIFKRILNQKERPSCVFFPDDYCAVTAMQYAKNMGISIPDDISIAGFDSADFSSLLSPNLTTVAQDSKAIGKIAADSILQLINKQLENSEIIVPIKLIVGETIKKI
jgi:DNA-binding LacI/PurR family transcriptional regulator